MAAAARLGIFGLAEKSSRVTLYSSVPLKSFREEEDEQTPLKQTHPQHSSASKRYGVSLVSKETAHQRYHRRQLLCNRRLKICDWSVYLALSGLILAVLDVELNVNWAVTVKNISYVIRIVIILSTIFLNVLIVAYHWTEMQILSADTGHGFMGMSLKRKIKLSVELIICSICPFPNTGQVDWPILSESIGSARRALIPLNVLLTVPMFFRLYLLCRAMVMHSIIIQDASTRAIASFNRVHVDFPFVLKSSICNRPLTFVMSVSVTFWGCSSWIMTQCERYVSGNKMSTMHYITDYMWFEAVTFFAIGYGDLQVETYCGRSLAALTGIVGALFSSLITVLLSQRMLLSLAEKRVNQVIAESQLINLHKNAAAKVLQSTWRVVRWQRRLSTFNGNTKSNMFHLRMAQRTLLQSVIDFRRCRWKLRLKQEDEDDAITIRRAFSETEERLRLLRTRQQQVTGQLQTLTSKLDRLNTVVAARNRLRARHT